MNRPDPWGVFLLGYMAGALTLFVVTAIINHLHGQALGTL